jgi:hypothetical protein
MSDGAKPFHEDSWLSTPNPQVVHTPHGLIWLGAEPSSDVIPDNPPPLLQEPKNLEPTSKPSRKSGAGVINRGQVPDRWPYFLERLSAEDERWEKVSLGALVKIAQQTSFEAVSYALAIANLTTPILNSSAYGWIAATAARFKEAGVE